MTSASTMGGCVVATSSRGAAGNGNETLTIALMSTKGAPSTSQLVLPKERWPTNTGPHKQT